MARFNIFSPNSRFNFSKEFAYFSLPMFLIKETLVLKNKKIFFLYDFCGIKNVNIKNCEFFMNLLHVIKSYLKKNVLFI